MAFCEQCGTKLADDERFCSSCGKPIEVVQSTPPQTNRVAAELVAATAKEATKKEKICAKCGKTLDADLLICPYCKTETGPKHCAKCGKELASDWLVCPYCKTEV